MVVVPQKFSLIPPILLRVPEAWTITDRKNNITPRTWCKKPKEILVDVYLGGECKLDLVPLAQFSKNLSIEIQTLVFTPTRVLLTDLPKSTNINVLIKKPEGKFKSIGISKSNSVGELLFPPITLGKLTSNVSVELTWPKDKKYRFTIRAIK